MSTEQTAINKLQTWFERKTRDNRLIEMCITVGSDPRTGADDVARVALAMLEYKPLN